MKPNILKVKSFLKKQSGWIVSIVLAFFLFADCSGKDYSARIAKRDKENKELAKAKDSVIDINKIYEKQQKENIKQITKAEEKIVSLNKKIAKIEANSSKQIAKLKHNDVKEWKNYYQDITKLGDKDISVIDTSLKFTRKPLIIIANKIIKGEVAKAKLEVANKIISETRVVANEHKENYNAEVQKNENLKFVISSDSLIKVNLNKNVDDLKIELNQAKKPKIVPILIGIGVGIIGGTILAK
jgi:TolA-binding protein